MRPASYIAIGLAIAAAVNVTALVKARAEQKLPAPVIVWVQFATSAHGNIVQHITTAKYLARTTAEAMALCEKERRQIIAGLERELLKPIIEPRCTTEKPWSWVGP